MQKSKRKKKKRTSVIVSIQIEEPFIDCLGLDLVTSAVYRWCVVTMCQCDQARDHAYLTNTTPHHTELLNAACCLPMMGLG